MTKVTMDIPAARASQFAQMFEEEGLEVSWEGPMEKRAGGFETEIVHIVYYLTSAAGSGVVGGAAYAAAQAAVKKIRARFPAVEVTVEDTEETPDGR